MPESTYPSPWIRRLFAPLTTVRRAGHADPAPVTIVVLARDEERCIARCLDSVVNRGIDVLVVDTGSRDDTISIVGRYRDAGVTLVTVPWPDSFAETRNFAIDTVGAGWVVFLDADEWLTERSADQLSSCLSSLDGLAGLESLVFAPRIHDVNLGGFADDIPRVLRAESGIRFTGAVHEYPVIRGAKEDTPVGIVGVDIDVRHDGYHEAVATAKHKRERNLALLEAAHADDPDNPRWLYYLLRDALPVLDGLRIGELCAALRDLADRDPQTADRHNAHTYYRLALTVSCQGLVALGSWPAVRYHCDELDRIEGHSSPDAHYFRAMLALVDGTGTDDELLRAVRMRGNDTLISNSVIDPSGRHLDALIAAQLETFRDTEEAARYRELCDPWTDVFFDQSVPRLSTPEGAARR